MVIEDRELSSDENLYWQDRLQKRKANFLEARDFLKKHALRSLSLEEAGEISRVRLHPADLVTQAQDERTLELLLGKNLKVIREVEEALGRLEHGTFGICESCSEMIARNRLEAIPETRYCLSCQTDIEKAKDAQQRSTKAAPAIHEVSGEIFEKSRIILVSDVMQKQPVTVRLDQGADVASQLMFDHDIKHLPVVDNHGDLQGIISDRDLLSVVLEPISWTSIDEVIHFWHNKLVSTIMTTNLHTVSPDMTLREAGIILLSNRISCLPVVKGNHLLGILTDTDFVKLMCR